MHLLTRHKTACAGALIVYVLESAGITYHTPPRTPGPKIPPTPWFFESYSDLDERYGKNYYKYIGLGLE
jgi:hypothetical protein